MPGGASVVTKEKVRSGNVKSWRWIENYHPNPTSGDAKREFRATLSAFIDRLNGDGKAVGFVLSNIGTNKYQIARVMRTLEKNRIDKERVKVITKFRYRTYYPELLVITISN